MGAASAAIMGGEPVAGAIGAIVGEIIWETYREGGFGNTPLDQNSDTYQTQVEYGVAFAKMAAVMCVGIMGGDVETAAFAAENAARHNAYAVFFDPNERTLTQEERAEEERLESERFRAWNAQRIASGNLNTVEQLCELYNTPLPDLLLDAGNYINEPIQEWQDNVQNTIQVAHAISPVTGFIANRTLGGIPNTLELLKIPTTCGGTLLTLAPGLQYVGAAGKVAFNTVKGSLKSMVSALRGAGRTPNATTSVKGTLSRIPANSNARALSVPHPTGSPFSTAPSLPSKTASSLGTVHGEYTLMNPGPLRTDLAKTFSGGRYKVVTLGEDTILYRSGNTQRPLGEFFTRKAPNSIMQSRMESAVMGKWPNGSESIINSAIEVRIPAGTQVYVGRTGTQQGVFLGGTEQIVIPGPTLIKGLNIESVVPLK